MELPIICISMVWTKGTEVMCGIGPRSHKAFEAKGLRGKVQEDIKRMGRNNIREIRYKGWEGGSVSQVLGAK